METQNQGIKKSGIIDMDDLREINRCLVKWVSYILLKEFTHEDRKNIQQKLLWII